MSNFALFVTAADVTSKELNRALVEIQDYEYGDMDLHGYRIRHAYRVIFSESLPSMALRSQNTTPPTMKVPKNNAFAGASISALYDFVRGHQDQLNKLQISDVFAVLDEQSMKTDTCLLVEPTYKDGSDELAALPDLRWMRLPRDMVWCTLANLDLANMGFQDFADIEGETDESGAYDITQYWKDVRTKEDENERMKTARGRMGMVMKGLRKSGHVN